MNTYKLLILSFCKNTYTYKYIEKRTGTYTDCLNSSKQYNRFTKKWKIVKLKSNQIEWKFENELHRLEKLLDKEKKEH